MSGLKSIVAVFIAGIPLIVTGFYVPFWLHILCLIGNITIIWISCSVGISQVRSWKRANNKHWHEFLKEE